MDNNKTNLGYAFITGLTSVGIIWAIAFGVVSCSEINARIKSDCIAKGGSTLQIGSNVQCIRGGGSNDH